MTQIKLLSNRNLSEFPTTLNFTLSDEINELTSGTTKLTYYMPHNMTITEARACLTLSGSTPTVIDVIYDDSSIFTSGITIDAGQFTSFDSSVQPSILTSIIVK